MQINPELQRNIWLDFNQHRLLITPIVLGMLAYLSFAGDISALQHGSFFVSLSKFFIFVWGTKNASECVLSEVNNNTWDFQRQTAISPWSMIWGKLIGSTLFSWYAAGLCFFFALILKPDDPSLLSTMGLLILGGLLTQGFACLLSLQILPQVHHEKNNRSFHYFLMSLCLGFPLTQAALYIYPGEVIIWYTWSIPAQHFLWATIGLFLSWTLIGLGRSMSKELQYAQIPWIWSVFVVFCMVYLSGLAKINLSATDLFSGILESPSLRLDTEDFRLMVTQMPYYVAICVAMLLAYLMIFLETLSIVGYKKLFLHLKSDKLKESLTYIPLWSIAYVFTLMISLITFFKLPFTEPRTLVLTLILFLTRDLVLVHYFSLSKTPKKAVSTAILYLFVLYNLIPLLLWPLGLKALLPAFIPNYSNLPLTLLSVGVQISLMVLWRVREWRR